MPGNIVIKPLQATFNRDSAGLGKMSPYYVVSLGEHRQKGSTCKNGGKNPQWKDAVTVEKTGDAFCTVELKGKRALFPDRNLGACQIPVHELTEEKSSRWYDILYKDKVEGRILIEANLIAGEGELVDKQGIHPLGTKSANAIDDRERREPLEIENRNAVSLAELANNKDGYDIKVIEPPKDGPQEEQRQEEQQERQDVMHVPVIDPSKASIDNMDNPLEERKVEVFEEERGAFKDKEAIQDVVQPRESVGGDEVDVPEERTEAEGQVKTELKTRERPEM